MNIDDISSLIKAQIKNYDKKAERSETGSVITVGDGIASVYGLDNCLSNELVEFSNGTYRLARTRFRSLCSAPTSAYARATPLSAPARSFRCLSEKGL